MSSPWGYFTFNKIIWTAFLQQETRYLMLALSGNQKSSIIFQAFFWWTFVALRTSVMQINLWVQGHLQIRCYRCSSTTENAPSSRLKTTTLQKTLTFSLYYPGKTHKVLGHNGMLWIITIQALWRPNSVRLVKILTTWLGKETKRSSIEYTHIFRNCNNN